MENEMNNMYVDIKKMGGIFDLRAFVNHIEGKLAVIRQSLVLDPAELQTDLEEEDLTGPYLLGLYISINDICSDLSQFRQQLTETDIENSNHQNFQSLAEIAPETGQ